MAIWGQNRGKDEVSLCTNNRLRANRKPKIKGRWLFSNLSLLVYGTAYQNRQGNKSFPKFLSATLKVQECTSKRSPLLLE